MTAYQKEQSQALDLVRNYLATLDEAGRRILTTEIDAYLTFRGDVAAFLGAHFGAVCSAKCFHSRRSACCSREGIITFFADVLINALMSTHRELDCLAAVLARPNTGTKCIYLTPDGCLWRIKPIVCEMFVCDPAQKEVFSGNPAAEKTWTALRRREKDFRWPDKPVLFDRLERRVIDAGYTSSLMYLHNSPGLLRVKQRAGLL